MHRHVLLIKTKQCHHLQPNNTHKNLTSRWQSEKDSFSQTQIVFSIYDISKLKTLQETKLAHLKFLNKLFSIRSRHYDVALRWLDEAIIHGFVNESEKVVVVPINIQQTHLQSFKNQS